MNENKQNLSGQTIFLIVVAVIVWILVAFRAITGI